jgi:hypothetical protein
MLGKVDCGCLFWTMGWFRDVDFVDPHKDREGKARTSTFHEGRRQLGRNN